MKHNLTSPTALAVAVVAVTMPAATAAPTLVVRPGHSIQAVLDAAAPGATVVVRQGTYRESLDVRKPVRLIARGHVLLRPPATAPVDLCTQDPDSDGRMPGICVAGSVADPRQEGSPVVTPVRRVTIRGFHLRGFTAAAIEVYGARRLTLSHMSAGSNPGGAVFVSHSSRIRIDHLLARHNGARGVDVHERVRGFSLTSSRMRGNHGEGVFVGDSHRGHIFGNLVRGNCAGILLLDENIPGDTGVGQVRIDHNRIASNNRSCAGDDEGAPSMSGNGLLLVGTRNTLVEHNRVSDNRGDPAAQVGFGGLALLDAHPITGGAAPTHNRISNNVVRGNTPADVTYDGTGRDNVLRYNG